MLCKTSSHHKWLSGSITPCSFRLENSLNCQLTNRATTVECPIPFGGLLIIAMRGWQPRNMVSISINMYHAEEWQDEHAFMQLHKHQ